MVDMDQLPAILQWLSYLFPTTYAAEAMRFRAGRVCRLEHACTLALFADFHRIDLKRQIGVLRSRDMWCLSLD